MMVAKPEQWVKPMAVAGANQYTFHIEATDNPGALIKDIRENGMKVRGLESLEFSKLLFSTNGLAHTLGEIKGQWSSREGGMYIVLLWLCKDSRLRIPLLIPLLGSATPFPTLYLY